MDARQEERYARQEGCLQNKNRLDVSRCGTECMLEKANAGLACVH